MLLLTSFYFLCSEFPQILLQVVKLDYKQYFIASAILNSLVQERLGHLCQGCLFLIVPMRILIANWFL